MYAELSAAIASAKAALEIVKGASKLTNYNELVGAVSEVNAKLLEATSVALQSQEKQAALAARISDLEKELSRLSEKSQKRDRYRLHEFSTGTLAYSLKDELANGEPMHFVCATCFDRGDSTKMHLMPGRRRLWCPSCKVGLQIEADPPIRSRVVRKNTPFARDW